MELRPKSVLGLKAAAAASADPGVECRSDFDDATSTFSDSTMIAVVSEGLDSSFEDETFEAATGGITWVAGFKLTQVVIFGGGAPEVNP